MRPIMRLANAVMLVLFVSWGAFQYNDPDALVWAAVYLSAAVECILYFMGRLPRTLGVLYGALCAVWAVILGVNVAIVGEFIFDETGREMMGLAICAGWTFVMLRIPARTPEMQPESGFGG